MESIEGGIIMVNNDYDFKDTVVYLPRYDVILISRWDGLWFEADAKTPKKMRSLVEEEIIKSNYVYIGKFK